MARVSEAFMEHFSPMSEEPRDPIIFVVDMLNGFVQEGALHDKAIQAIVPSIIELIEEQQCRTIFVADAHPPRTREFQSYPTHCVIGTKEGEVLTELVPYIQELFHKNSTNTFTCPDFQEFLAHRLSGYQDIILTGCCSDICILQFALCLHAWLNEHNEVSKRILIPINCIDTFHIEGIHDAIQTNEFSIANMAANGIHMITAIKRG